MDDMISSDVVLSSAQHHNNELEEQMVVSPQPTEEGRNKQQHGGGGREGWERKPRPSPPDEVFNCPRCNSTKTKFCYFNNYNESQPRHFCKTCRRYWTQGGVLRNVPVGGGCRKNRRSSTTAASGSSSKVINNLQHLLLSGGGQLPMTVPAATGSAVAMMDFPNVLPTFMSSGGGSLEIPGMDYHHHHNLTKLPFLPLSLSTPPPLLAPSSRTMTSFLDILRGGLLDGNSSNQETSDYFIPDAGGMAMPSFDGIMVGGDIIKFEANNIKSEQDLEMEQGVDGEAEEGAGGMMGWLSQHEKKNGGGLQMVDHDAARRHQQGSNDDGLSASNSRGYFYSKNKGSDNGGGGGGGLMNLMGSSLI